MLDQYTISKVASYFYRFLTDLFQNWVILRERYSKSDANPTDMLTQLIWFNKNLKIDNTTVFFLF